MTQAPAGWYPDPSGAPGQRYFDGTTWTQWTYAADPGSAPHLVSDHQRGIGALRRGEAGDVAGAISDLESLLAEQLQTLGPDHPDTLDTRTYLAKTRWRAGDLAGAISDLESLLAEQVRILGRDHPKTVDTRTYLAAFRSDTANRLPESTSPDGRYTVRLHHFRASDDNPRGDIIFYDDYRPELYDSAVGQALPLGTWGSPGSARWRSDSVVVMSVRIGNHLPGLVVEVVIDCQRRMASVHGAEPGPLGQVEVLLKNIRSMSPDRRYIVRVHPFEAPDSDWVATPELFDIAAGQIVLALKDRYWHLDSANWPSEPVVVMSLRNYRLGVRTDFRKLPLRSSTFEVIIDCRRLTASVNGTEPGPLDQLDDALESSLHRPVLPKPDIGLGLAAGAKRPRPKTAAPAQVGTDQSSSQQPPVIKAAKPVVGLGLATRAKRPGGKNAAPAAEAAPSVAASEGTQAAPVSSSTDPSSSSNTMA